MYYFQASLTSNKTKLIRKGEKDLWRIRAVDVKVSHWLKKEDLWRIRPVDVKMSHFYTEKKKRSMKNQTSRCQDVTSLWRKKKRSIESEQ